MTAPFPPVRPFAGKTLRAAVVALFAACAAAGQNDRPGADALRELDPASKLQGGAELERSRAKWPEYEREIDVGVARQDEALKKGGVEVDDAVKFYENRAQVRGGPADLYLYGRLLGNTGRIEEARAKFEAALRIDAFFPWAYHGLGTCHAKREKYEEAVKAYKQALELSPDFLRSMEPLAGCLVQLGRVPEAEELLKKIVERNPRHPQALLTLAKLQAARIRYGEAIATVKKYLEILPKDAEGRRILGYCLRKGEMWDEAIRLYQDILAENQDDFSAWRAMGEIRLLKGENKLARECFESALKTRGDVGSPEMEELRKFVEELGKRPDVEKKNPNQKTPQQWLEILLNSSEPERCEEAMRVLRSAPPDMLDAELFLEINKGFLKALRLKHAPTVRALVLRHLTAAPLYEPAALINLVSLFVDDPDPRVRAMAVYFLGETRVPDAVPAAMQAIGDADPYVFECAHDALFKLTPALTAPRLPETVDKAVMESTAKAWRDWYEANRDRYRRFEPKK
jgi:tetratricopeptide (TPR) repeat protein